MPRPDGREPWEGSTRRDRLPDDWPEIRQEVIVRDEGVCQWPVERCERHQAGPAYAAFGCEDCRRCGVPGNHVDHQVRGDNHALDNLWLLCEPHHLSKSGGEGAAARTRLHNPPEAHPALS